MTLKEKLIQEIEYNKKASVNWDERRTEWQNSVVELNSLIKEWFRDYEQEGLVHFKITSKTISEEYLGSYDINVLHLCFPNEKEVIVEPIGALIIGASGRCDIYLRGYNSEKYYILRNKNSDDGFSWNLVNPQIKHQSKALSNSNLEEIIDKWIS